ncbi:MAG: hypothetical protein EA363_06320 [Balneolaceae bacterium]|nr:MAG: hypothetical protein EA363_06320 [Balneolaceae bacterium]
MKRLSQLSLFALAILVLAQCEPTLNERTPDPGQADFSNYVAVGNSLTAGYADNALHRDGQLNSFPNILAEQMEEAGGGFFFQPLVNPGVGSNADGQARLVLRLVMGPGGTPTLAPVPAAESGQDIFSRTVQGPFNNMGVVGARSFHLLIPGYGNLNPFFGRLMSDPQATVLGDAMMAEPTFFTLWIGNNDVLGYATSGGTGQGFAEIGDPAAVAGNDITPMNVFSGSIDAVAATLTAGGAKGAVINIPDVTSIPFFTTVPWNGLVLSAEQAQQLRAGYAAQGVPEQFIPDFQPGQNGFVIADPDLPDAVPPQLRFRMAQEGELILLSVPQNEIREEGLGSITPIPDQFTLRGAQIQEVQQATNAFNTKLRETASAFDLAFVDVNSVLEAAKTGLVFDAVLLNTRFVQGGIFSLDGVHISPRGAAVVANEVMKSINAKYGSTLSPVNISAYEGVQFP